MRPADPTSIKRASLTRVLCDFSFPLHLSLTSSYPHTCLNGNLIRLNNSVTMKTLAITLAGIAPLLLHTVVAYPDMVNLTFHGDSQWYWVTVPPDGSAYQTGT
ncbi:hypothetical protein F4780DRAFT_775086 [Xylariomycetidae sp. FL0641]|nr:hypothetical protein F4780DRAFT_775086 [Xylariomycetidae sp. FL0641]